MMLPWMQDGGKVLPFEMSTDELIEKRRLFTTSHPLASEWVWVRRELLIELIDEIVTTREMTSLDTELDGA